MLKKRDTVRIAKYLNELSMHGLHPYLLLRQVEDVFEAGSEIPDLPAYTLLYLQAKFSKSPYGLHQYEPITCAGIEIVYEEIPIKDEDELFDEVLSRFPHFRSTTFLSAPKGNINRFFTSWKNKNIWVVNEEGFIVFDKDFKNQNIWDVRSKMPFPTLKIEGLQQNQIQTDLPLTE
jgi:hypothetical protein